LFDWAKADATPAASLFIAHLNWTPKRAQVVMGHSSIEMTFDLYATFMRTRTPTAKPAIAAV
jgi:hypothetical protein